MPITQEHGRWRSVRTPDERKQSALNMVSKLNQRERFMLQKILNEYQSSGRSPIASEVAEIEWEEQPLPVSEWLLREDLIGETGKDMYPQLRADLAELFEGDYHEAILTGCIDQDAIVMCSDGSMPRLGDLIGRKTSVLTVDETTGIGHAESTEGVDSGVRQVLDLTLGSGMRVRLTPDHRVLTTRGWVPAAHLKETDWVLRPRFVTYTPSMTNLRDEEVKLLAYWVTDGSSSATRARFCDGRVETGREVIASLHRLGYSSTTNEPYAKNGAWEVQVARVATSGFRDWLGRHKILDVGTDAREVPDAICRAPLKQVALFLNRVWAAEGTVSSTSAPRFQLGMKSERFIRQVQLLLLRWGIQSRIYRTTSRRHGTECVTWLLAVSGVSNLRAFSKEIGVVFSKERECADLLASIDGKRANTNVDVVPLTWGEANDELRDRGVVRPADSPWWRLSAQRGRHLSRDMHAALVQDFPAAVQTLDRFPETVFYERIKSLVPVETRIPVADIGVPGPTRFTANGITVHNSIGWGKDFFATTACLRMLYELNCLKNPQHTLGLAQGEPIHIVPISKTVAAARRVVFGGVCKKLALAPWFRGKYEETMEEVRFKKKGIYIVGGASQDAAALGLNVIFAIIDESNFLGEGKVTTGSASAKAEDKATMIYNALARRVKARYKRHGVKGMVMLVSSKRSTSDFTEKRIHEAIKVAEEAGDPGVFVRDYAIWNVHPEPFKNQKWFRVSVNSKEGRCKLLEREEDVPLPGSLVFRFPEDYLDEFRNDPDGATRDIAGIATDFIGRPFITHRPAIDKMFVRDRPTPFVHGEWYTNTLLQAQWNRVMTKDANDDPAPFCCPGSLRHAHIDMSVNQCATALIVAHIAGKTEVERRNPETHEKIKEWAPVIHVDVALRVMAPDGGDIDHSEVRSVVYRLIAEGYPIRSISMDQFMAPPNLQLFKRRGLKTAEVGARTAQMKPYITLRQAIYEARLIVPWHPILDRELRELEIIDDGKRVKHPLRGSKDLADALGAAVYYLTEHGRMGDPLGPSLGTTIRTPLTNKPKWSPSGPVWYDEEDQERETESRSSEGFSSWMV